MLFAIEESSENYKLYSEVRDSGLLSIGNEFRFPATARNFSIFHSVQTDSGFHTNIYLMGTIGKAVGTSHMYQLLGLRIMDV
jgi:hypothetical protein